MKSTINLYMLVLLVSLFSVQSSAEIIAPDVIFGDTVSIDINYFYGGSIPPNVDDGDPGTDDSSVSGWLIINGYNIVNYSPTGFHNLDWSISSADSFYYTLFPTAGSYLIEVTAYNQNVCNGSDPSCPAGTVAFSDGPFSTTINLIEPAAVPLPPGAWLFMSALGSVLGIRSANKRR